ncbi:tryptophan synthase subunit alpha [Kozakia baliensis]|uniref:Tryptophan synthase alpha chain n=1 Tax=Kozakia baliensis TaxID=153496 RepID=A0A1D8UWG4_9PROT|nr:tryptophan synthase subunit alpha [Kozakia baliensis]AOX17984.1 tryptophan synthase subunit alpha [Kozakia baliensis]GBR23999.1 tryptophan synthase subunit alpha [Kozakia baliensis NRIC 0488]GEL64635.1 tryptophan synthase alpha chain [Kozakia baliensis]
MSRIKTRFDALKAEGRGALIPYLQAYDPDLETSLEILRGMPAAGADLIEIGVPFSDPSADGPTIQAAALRGLKAGATLTKVLEMVRAFREGDNETPIILMGYLNPIDSYGPARFCKDAAQAGVDGLIIVDLPKEEADLIEGDAQGSGLDIIRLIAPNTPDARLPYVLDGASGFIYYVSITGITGTRTASEDELANALPRIRKMSDLPIAIGFGIRTPEQAAYASRTGDAAVVASALISTLATTLENGRPTAQTVPSVLTQLKEIASAVRGA